MPEKPPAPKPPPPKDYNADYKGPQPTDVPPRQPRDVPPPKVK